MGAVPSRRSRTSVTLTVGDELALVELAADGFDSTMSESNRRALDERPTGVAGGTFDGGGFRVAAGGVTTIFGKDALRRELSILSSFAVDGVSVSVLGLFAVVVLSSAVTCFC